MGILLGSLKKHFKKSYDRAFKPTLNITSRRTYLTYLDLPLIAQAELICLREIQCLR